ncbi:MAG: ATP phosphoribosyltransferase [Candidatus Aminicenantales bacterium]
MKRLKIVIPKGRLYGKVVGLLNDAGFGIEADEKVSLLRIAAPEVEAKVMKPQNIPRLIELGSHDIGFTGYDWIAETGADVLQIMDLGFDPVKIVAAIPSSFTERQWKKRKIVVASEYECIARKYLNAQGYDHIFLRTFGATEVFPPDDADMIIDNVSTGRTLKEHGLKIAAVVMESTTRFIANRKSFQDPWKREKISEMQTLFQAVLDARGRVMLEMNVPAEKLSAIVKKLPCMRSPTVAPLYGNLGYAVKVAVPKENVARLIPLLKKMGACDILEYKFEKVVL